MTLRVRGGIILICDDGKVMDLPEGDPCCGCENPTPCGFVNPYDGLLYESLIECGVTTTRTCVDGVCVEGATGVRDISCCDVYSDPEDETQRCATQVTYNSWSRKGGDPAGNYTISTYEITETRTVNPEDCSVSLSCEGTYSATSYVDPGHPNVWSGTLSSGCVWDVTVSIDGGAPVPDVFAPTSHTFYSPAVQLTDDFSITTSDCYTYIPASYDTLVTGDTLCGQDCCPLYAPIGDNGACVYVGF